MATTFPPRVRLGMVGGGEGAFIGAVHRIAARLDDHYTLVAGALSSTAEKSLRSGAAIGLERTYPDYETMAREEAARPDGIEAVAIVTPNDQHAPAAEAFLKAGIHVICDKPVTTTLKDAKRLKALAQKHGRLFAVTHNYTGYPMVRHARRLVADGALGTLRVVQVEYAQEWLTERLESTGQKQAGWRSDPKRSGAGGCIGDIGTHAYNLADFITGLTVESLSAEVSSFVKGRVLDDNVQVQLRYAGGARGSLWASQVAPGNENGLRIRVYGSKAGLEWMQEHPNQLRFSPFGQPTQVISRGTPAASPDAARVSRVPSGHPEGYLEGFANLYTEIAAAIRAARPGKRQRLDKAVTFPTIDDGIKGMVFIETALKSSAKDGRWTKL
ncbi:Gfo/Idh/MocA family protein [Piscinibacter gummiphilus]|uniref:Oxidoreductase n=1 Tax=Piscinibacter gummiphilus TaxID=946333 RepID=A0A1W6LFD7_9BURK|nr:Gfo/Idh/MocA family oxidoreductase [Piscinibacter gummiphilus]ARN22936.1 oxidoreductase [Piscinibacter gummiphilus]ATU67635.1 gfo/Idh/MocA family oxidoreductase [Piscinibacter gummiphilus]GLS96763.1 oxidoreductase [Piscinibacter gummiphilus]